MRIRSFLMAAIIIGIALSCTPKTFLILKTDTDIKAILPAAAESSFTIQWQHSVEKELWEEFFKVKEDAIYIEGTRFKTFGAGVPSNAGNDTYIKDGWVHMVGIDRKIGNELRVRTGKTTAHKFIAGENSIDMAEPGASYIIETRTMPVIQAWSQKLLLVVR
ncbi:DUF1850 domain-containing protein [Alkalihalobacillus sp. TS-13]|uniref:DUF1850 domain-containing protein n=1 Tax=Alkalihalobacillus sp. TS-13 TaxID=2842455 RepID=UPI001C86746A|nr:DUF1850 domain-containing protein [Alkalihalobacillus sp. TS-13]